MEHIQAIITAVSTESHVHLSDKCIGTREALLGAVLLKIRPNSDLEQLINTEAQILHQKRKSEVCDYCRR